MNVVNFFNMNVVFNCIHNSFKRHCGESEGLLQVRC